MALSKNSANLGTDIDQILKEVDKVGGCSDSLPHLLCFKASEYLPILPRLPRVSQSIQNCRHCE